VLSKAFCPACRGTIALWAVKPLFTCHHCEWALESNRSKAFARALTVALSTEALLLVVIWALTGNLLRASGLWLAGSGLVGYGIGYLAFVASLKINPLHPRRRNEA
jgi:hypothetical protein